MTEGSPQIAMQVSQFFCEDVRVEEGGKPILLGLMAPLIIASEDIVFQNAQVFTHLVIPISVQKVDLELELVTWVDGERQEDHYSMEFHKQTTDRGASWAAIATKRVDLIVRLGDPAIEANLVCNGTRYQTTLQAISFETFEESSGKEEE